MSEKCGVNRPCRILDLLGYEYQEPQLLRILLHSGFGAENRFKPLSKFQATSSRTSAGFLNGRNSPRVTVSGTGWRRRPFGQQARSDLRAGARQGTE
jgi:hypothetical protein